MKRILLLVVVLSACAAPRAPRPPGPPQSEPRPTQPVYRYERSAGELPRSAEQVSGPAVISLLNQAQAQLAGGRPEQAVAALERAQRIEPRNPFVWQQLAVVQLYQNLPLEAESMAQRSNSLARGNPYIETENWRLIGLARELRGDDAGAEEAAGRMAAMQQTIDD